MRACDTQWRYAGMGGVPTGLDGAACAALIARLLPKWKRHLADDGLKAQVDMHYSVADALDDLHVIELATLAAHMQRRAADKEAQA